MAVASEAQPRPRLAIGHIARPVGVRGELKVVPLTDDWERFRNLVSVDVGENEAVAAARSIERVRIDPKQVVVKFSGVDSRESAEGFRGQYLFVDHTGAVPARKGSYRVDDLVGAEVVTEDGRVVGILHEVLAFPGHDIWSLRRGEKEVLIPAVKAFIKRVDVKARRVEIRAIEGLIEDAD